MRQPNGDMRGVNYDHTILGWRGAIALLPRMRNARQAVLPTVQAMWYVPQGLNIWEQIICEFPGHYARDAEKCNQKFPGPEPEVNRFDGPAWQPPKIYFEDHDPIYGGSVEERLDRFNWAISEGDRDQSYGLFLGLAADPANRDARLWAWCDTATLNAVEANFRARGQPWAAVANALTAERGEQLRAQLRRTSGPTRMPLFTLG
jgi:hypothetical protein